MRRVGALEAERFGVQQYRAPLAGKAEQPPADGDQRHSGDAELPLVEPGEDAYGLPYRVGETVYRGK
ncbi:MAG: hypothetical protein E6G90_02005 [Alphaproteobacteria bacterium]|nr:MAG: hypothetical protein E6G90_02005 [Alphaproteobacteria bacterium]